jgi:hypothetical protein
MRSVGCPTKAQQAEDVEDNHEQDAEQDRNQHDRCQKSFHVPNVTRSLPGRALLRPRLPHWRPLHVARFGPKFDAQGVLAGPKDPGRCIRYLTKYLTKHVADWHTADTDAQRDHADRLMDALRYEPCSSACANWLRYGIQPKDAKQGQRPGACKGKAHRADNLGYAGRRVLVSRKWSGKTLADHRADRKAWLLDTLGLSATDPTRYVWQPVLPGDPDHMAPAQRLLHVVADRITWKQTLDEARRRAAGDSGQPEMVSARTAA